MSYEKLVPISVSSKATFTNTKHIAALLSLEKKKTVTFKEDKSFVSSVKKSGNFSERDKRKMFFFPSAVNRKAEFLVMVTRSHLSLKSVCLFL